MLPMRLAIDALRAEKIPIGVNVKMIFEGEEEAGSTNLERTMQAHKDLLGADLLLTCDGPVHPSGRPLIFFGARGDVGLDVTVYGPVRALHSGHYGNWAPNPAMELSRLLASMTVANGRVTIPGYYDDVGRPYYYAGGAVAWVPQSSPLYVGYVNHWHAYGPAYHRWYGHYGYRYRAYRRR